MDAAHIAACSFEAWYPAFEHVTFRSAVLPLPHGFEDFLVQDGVFLPSSSAAMPKRHMPDEHAVEGVDYTEWSSSDEDADSDIQAAIGLDQFEGFRQQVDAAITALGGKVLPKLNWSAPKDAAWVTATNTVACTNADEVLLLLQSSDRIAHDICHAFDACAGAPASALAADARASAADPASATAAEPPSATAAEPGSAAPAATAAESAAAPAAQEGQSREQQQAAQEAADGGSAAVSPPGVQQEAAGGAAAVVSTSTVSRPEVRRVLALRAWRELRPGREFRCFVRGREVVGISQRDMTQRFPFLPEQRDQLQEAILNFHEDHIMAGFPLADYTHDVCIPSCNDLLLVDFDPVGGAPVAMHVKFHNQNTYDAYVTTRDKVLLVDFNPVGGATAPLLFDDWADLGYAFVATEAAEAAVAAGAAEAATPGTGVAATEAAAASSAASAAEAEEEAIGPGGGGSRGSQLAAAQAIAARLAGASLHDAAGAGGGSGEASLQNCDSSHVNGSNGGSRNGHGSQNGSANGGSGREQGSAGPPQLPEVDFRIIDEPVVMRSAAQGYGVPYDFVDNGVNGALADFVAQARHAGA